MTQRIEAVDALLNGLKISISAAGLDKATQRDVDQVFETLRRPLEPLPTQCPARLAACDHLPQALATARSEGNRNVAQMVAALGEIDPLLSWVRRKDSEKSGPSFHDGHANALIIGPNGLEERSDIWVGVSLMAPDVQYPVHTHPPEEIYVVLSSGEWTREDAPWFTPGIGGVVHNRPQQRHSMRAHKQPLLAFWLLWT